MNQDVENAIGSYVGEPEAPVMQARPQRVYMVACYRANRVEGRYGFASPSRMHVHGVFYSPLAARAKCQQMNEDLRKSRYTEKTEDGELRYKNHVISYKVRDAK